MKNGVIAGVSGVVAGVILTMVIIWSNASAMMLLEDEVKYGFDEAVEKFEKSAIESGWKIPTIHDLQATMKKFGKDVKKVTVFELCHPDHAYEILSRDQERVVSSLMPCRIAIYEKADGKVYASRMNTSLMGNMMDGVIPKVMKTASTESENILNTILK